MKLDVYNLQNAKVGEVDVSDEVFGTAVKPHLHHEVVRWQLASEALARTPRRTVGRGRSARRSTSRRAPARAPGQPTLAARTSAAAPSSDRCPAATTTQLPEEGPPRARFASALSMRVGEGQVKVVDALASTGTEHEEPARAPQSLAALGGRATLLVDRASTTRR
jgi:large subunit ribosomal protein L4